MADTKELRKLDPKTARIKAWMPFLTAITSLAGVIFVAILQFGTAKESSVTAAIDQTKVVVEQINNNVIPRLQALVDSLTKENTTLRERIAKLEGQLEEIRYRRTHKVRKPKPEPTSPPELVAPPVQQMIPKIKLPEKIDDGE